LGKQGIPLAASWHTNVHEYAARRLDWFTRRLSPAFADAVYKPEELMLPKPAVHVTAVLLLPLTLAVN